MNRFIFISVLIILVSLAGLSLAGIPKMINYQGMLTQSNGTTPVPNGNYNLTFKIYGSLAGTDSLWREYHSNVPVTNGLFNVILGSITTLNLPFDTTYWLGIKVGTDSELSPRIRLTSMGYAYRAQWADTANYAFSAPGGAGGDAWDFRITDGADTTLITAGAWGIARYGNVLYGNADSTHVNLGVACITGTSGQNYKYCTVGGGFGNTASGWYATVGGGDDNTASDNYATVGGGYDNTASGGETTVGGGAYNTASTAYATVGGGYGNSASGYSATVGGGFFDTASGYYSTVPGGVKNTASGYCSFAAGYKAKALHSGAFVWADSTDADFASTKTNQFSIRAMNGVRIASNAGGSKSIGVGERYRDNGIVAWGKVTSGGTLSADFGVTSVTHDSAGAYTITLDATASDAATLIPIAQAEVESPGTIRIVSINQISTKTFGVYINNSSFTRENNDFVFLVTAR